MGNSKFIEKLIEPRHLPNCKPSWKKAFEYAKLMEQGIDFPPVKIYLDSNNQWTYNDGRHRVMAAKLAGKLLKVKHKDNKQR